jgi:hypothetical protein
MIGYGALLLVAAGLSSAAAVLPPVDGGVKVAAWSAGALMVLAGFSCVQGRRSIRLGGLYVGVFTPLILAGYFTWKAAATWNALATAPQLRGQGITYSALALLSVIALYLIATFRPREGIESRGYAVSLPAAPMKFNHTPGTSGDQAVRHSEAG